MTERECCWWCIKHCQAGKFWNNFCRSSTTLTYPVLFLVFMNMLHWVYFAATANNFGALSDFQYWGYFFSCSSGLLFFMSTLLAIHSINVLWPSRLRIILVELGLIITLIFMICTLFTFLYTPGRGTMQSYVYEYYVVYGRNPGFMENIEREKKCCGVYSYKDYFEAGKNIMAVGLKLPQSCCKRRVGKCSYDGEDHDRVDINSYENPHKDDAVNFHTEHINIVIKNTTEFDLFHHSGCILKGYWELRNSAPKSFSRWIIYMSCTLAHTFSCVVVFTIFNYYICYDFPSRRKKLKIIHRRIAAVFKERDEVIEEATSNLEVAEYTIEGPAILEWYNVHYLPKWGSYGNIERIAREGFTLPKRYEFPLFPFDEYQKHPENFKTGSNLDIFEGTDVYVSPPPETADKKLKVQSTLPK